MTKNKYILYYFDDVKAEDSSVSKLDEIINSY